MERAYWVYITTNPNRTVLYVGRTNHLEQRLTEHWMNRGKPTTFADKYYCYNLLYQEETQHVLNSIEREKQLKGWSRAKKERLISESNPDWKFLNSEIMKWPPQDPFLRSDFYE